MLGKRYILIEIIHSFLSVFMTLLRELLFCFFYGDMMVGNMLYCSRVGSYILGVYFDKLSFKS